MHVQDYSSILQTVAHNKFHAWAAAPISVLGFIWKMNLISSKSVNSVNRTGVIPSQKAIWWVAHGNLMNLVPVFGGLGVECLPCMCQALDLIPGTIHHTQIFCKFLFFNFGYTCISN